MGLQHCNDDGRCLACYEAMRRVTLKRFHYVLYDESGEPLTTVASDYDLSDNSVRGIAIGQHERTPLSAGSGRTPYEHARALRYAEVRKYDIFKEA